MNTNPLDLNHRQFTSPGQGYWPDVTPEQSGQPQRPTDQPAHSLRPIERRAGILEDDLQRLQLCPASRFCPRRQRAAKQDEDGDGKSQDVAHVLRNTARQSLFKAYARKRILVRKIAEKPTGCLAPIGKRQQRRFTSQ